MKRWLLLSLGTLFSVVTAPAYYHFVHYSSRNGPFVTMPERFDLNVLTNRSVAYFVSDQGPAQFAPRDTLPAVLSQIQAAARVWNGVETSDLRLVYGGLAPDAAPGNTPAIEVQFTDDLPPGVLALGGPTTVAQPSAGGFVPIIRSVVKLSRDLSQRPSYGESFFLTLVHEMGHAIGLQHTFTSGVMSTEVTRGTTKAVPLSPDDVAGVSLLYPARNFAGRTASVSGRVQMDGQGVSLASVVAMAPTGAVVSTLTHPDGTYRLEGLPPGQYYLYVHPLPPPTGAQVYAGDVLPPRGPDGQFFTSAGSFDLMFYPGARDFSQAQPVSLSAGSSRDGVQFDVSRRTRQTLYGIQTYGYPGDTPVKPPFLSMDMQRPFLVAAGYGLLGSNNQPVAGLRASVIGGSVAIANDGVKAYYYPGYLQMNFQLSPLAAEGPRHLLFSANGENYMLPAAFQLVMRQPPSILSSSPAVDNSGSRAVLLTGTNLSAATRVWFDGAPATVKDVDEANQRLTVVPPPAVAGYRAIVTALNPDGQSSMFLQAANPPSYTYDAGQPGSFVMTPNILPAGGEAMVQVDAIGSSFVDGQTTLSFGTSDAAVRRLWVVSPTRLLANVAVAQQAGTGAFSATATVGLQSMTQPGSLQIQPYNPRQLVVNPQAFNASTGQANLTAGSTAILSLANQPFALTSSALQVTLNDRPVSVTSVSGAQITFLVPASLSPGPTILKVQQGGDSSLPVVVQVDAPPATIAGFTAFPNTTIDVNRFARPGDTLTVSLTGLLDGVNLARSVVTVGGIDHPAVFVGMSNGASQFQFVLSPLVSPGAQVPVTVTVDGQVSAPSSLPIRN